LGGCHTPLTPPSGHPWSIAEKQKLGFSQLIRIFLRNNQSSILDLLAFVYRDDCENDERVCMAMYIDTQNRLYIKKYDTFWATYNRKQKKL
jgi:hypothetical protein